MESISYDAFNPKPYINLVPTEVVKENNRATQLLVGAAIVIIYLHRNSFADFRLTTIRQMNE